MTAPNAFDRLAPFPLASLRQLNSAQQAARYPLSPPVARHMARGEALHKAGLAELALVQFEQALALEPSDSNAASACAAVMMDLQRPAAALHCLLAHEESLCRTAEGAANLGLAHALTGDIANARVYYEKARALQPGHARTLGGLSRIAASAQDWDEAIALARQCIAQPVLKQAPNFRQVRTPAVAFADPAAQLQHHLHLIDLLLHARQPDAAAVALSEARTQLKDQPALSIRHALAQTLSGTWQKARDTLGALPDVGQHLQQAGDLFMRVGIAPPDGRAIDVALWCVQYLAAGTAEGDWACAHALTQVLRALLQTREPVAHAVWQAARPVLDSLALSEAETTGAHSRAEAADMAARTVPDEGFPPVPRTDSRWRVGFLVPRLDDAARTAQLAARLAAHDHTRFDLRVYSQTPQPQLRFIQPLLAHVPHVQEIAHMTDVEVIARVRMDGLDLLIDMTAGTPDARALPLAQRSARVQARMFSYARTPVAGACDYVLTDSFVHPNAGTAVGVAMVRMASSVWVSGVRGADSNGGGRAADADADAEATGAGSRELSFAKVMRLAVHVPPDCIDPATFGIWMDVLRGAPNAQLEFPEYGRGLQARLREQAAQRSVDAGRLQFVAADTASGLQPLGDLQLDSMHRSAPASVARAVDAGVPVLCFAGARTASKAGAGVLVAAGLESLVAGSPEAYRDEAVRLANDGEGLAAVREWMRVVAEAAAQPWWDARVRAREAEWAWVRMIETALAKKRPESFDVSGDAPGSNRPSP